MNKFLPNPLPMNHFAFKIRSFRAIDDPESCQRYIQGHRKILHLFNISSITSAAPDWIDDPDTIVVSVESPGGKKVYGGGRIQIANGKIPLPLETAVADQDPAVSAIINHYAAEGTAEICGLWNSREMAVNGVDSLHLGRAMVAVAGLLNLQSLFALCAPATFRNCMLVGYEVAREMGKQGRFIYPKDEPLATAMIIKDLQQLPAAAPRERAIIQRLRESPFTRQMVPGMRNRMLDIRYELVAPRLIPAYYATAV